MSSSATTVTPVANFPFKFNSNCSDSGANRLKLSPRLAIVNITSTSPSFLGEDAGNNSGCGFDWSHLYQVDNTLFKLPSRYFHEHKPQSPTAAGGPFVGITSRSGEGSSDEHPIKLSPLPYFVNAADFVYFVRIILALTLDFPTPRDYSLDQWLSVLKLSVAWGLTEIAALAMKELKEDPSKEIS
ncbi:hypothetical protein L218DRAFT_994350 [Marasmius fiardii PR-910]|nr:hypothetical protein L218DRAFT_994350 [Marasmius fiardii PR-910]